MNLTNILKRTYDETMKREGIKVTSYFGSESFDAFFRINNDGTNQKYTLIMFYGLDAPVQNGSIILIRGEKYIALNKETIECDVYYKSTMVKANGQITTNDFSVVGLPFYSTDMNYGNAKGDANLTIIDGRMEVVTADCELSRKLNINDYFNEWGRTWQIENIYYVDGICKVVLQVTADKPIEHTYTLSLAETNVLSAVVGDMLNLYATAYCDGIEDATAELAWHTSNPDVASIDNEGNVVFVAPGTVTLSVSWDEHNLIQYTNAIECVAISTDEEGNPDDESIALYVAEAKELFWDFENDPIEYSVTRGGVKVNDIPITFKAEYPASATLQKKISIVVSDGSALVNPADSRLMGKSFTLIASNAEYGLEHKQTIKVVSAW